MKTPLPRIALFLTAATLPLLALGSSHREAPFIAGTPRVDGTDFYMFRSYESGREGYVTLIANYLPLQDAYGGPNYFALDEKALYEIHIDNNGDAREDITFQFRFDDMYKNLTVPAGGKNVAVPLINIGQVDTNAANLNMSQSYSVAIVRGNRRGSIPQLLGNATSGGDRFQKPADNIGNKSIPDYASYAGNFIYSANIPGCSTPARVFAGQRKEGFVVNLGEVFDLVNTNPAGPRDGEPNTIADKNVTTLALEVPISCLTRSSEPVIGGWTTASLRQVRLINPKPSSPRRTTVEAGAWTQVSRLGSPLVNEVVVGLPDKDRFNGSEPRDDGQFATYVTNPTLPVLLNVLFGNAAIPPQTPRNDLVAAFLTGVPGLNQPANVRAAEMLRLNTSIAPTPVAAQKDLGVLGGDNAGFPNGRRPVDDVVDIELRVAQGVLCSAALKCGDQTADPNNGIPYTDGSRAAGPTAATSMVSGAVFAADTYLDTFPYLATPLPGSPNEAAY
ncbi:hypothetical protein HNQ60_004214 [Povalibacter uvarum]|uniref:DUF4331 domain-containing protein n=1 Tax=Povalibacter uvarum TaxID=732238 RepID=A0A841HRP9_9GAMM|nr:DUF4331 domain-containing protein [Povalibacter uvarum]MBB6095324.1 hypothetical protein [Povalibacter uvarum]